MTRINVFKTPTFLSKLFIVLGGIFSALGILLLLKALINGFNTKFPSGDWNSVLFTFQGLLFIIMGAGNLHVRKYYIEWDNNELKFLLPDTKKPESIKLGDIISVTIKLFEIDLQLVDKTRTLDLSNLQFEDLKKIKEKFEGINKTKNDQ
jgi:hypothetical protein